MWGTGAACVGMTRRAVRSSRELACSCEPELLGGRDEFVCDSFDDFCDLVVEFGRGWMV